MSKTNQPSQKEYLKSGRARKLPIYECLITKDWEDTMNAVVIVARQHVNSHITAGLFMVDLYAVGVKDCWQIFNVPLSEYEDLKDRYTQDGMLKLISCDYNLAHNVVYAGLEYALEYGIEPFPDFKYTSLILEEDNDDVPLIDVPVGMNGKPALFLTPGNPRNSYYLRQLEKHAGAGNFAIVDGDVVLDDLEEENDELDSDPWEKFDHWEKEDWENYFETAEIEAINILSPEVSYLFEKCLYSPAIKERQQATSGQTQNIKTNITFEPLKDESPGYKYLEGMEEIYFDVTTPGTKTGKLKKTLKRIQSMLKKNPEHRILHNYLYNAYLRLGKNKEAEALIRLMYEKFPDYVFSSIGYGNYLLEKSMLKEFEDIFKDKLDMALAFPGREEFHISEVVSFHELLINYFLLKGDTVSAYTHYTMLVEIEIPGWTSMTDITNLTVLKTITNEVKSLIAEVQSTPSKKLEILNLLSLREKPNISIE